MPAFIEQGSSMTLQEFITESLKQIQAGVTAARKASDGVWPKIGFDQDSPKAFRTDDGEAVFMVEFDVAVTVTERTEGGSKGGISIAKIFSADAHKATASEQSSISRLKFNVPVVFSKTEAG